jgi:hypothetical protein
MNEKSFAAAENALIGLLKRNLKELDYHRGRLVKAKTLPKAKQQIVSASIKKVNWHKVQIHDINGELEILREQYMKETDDREDPNG